MLSITALLIILLPLLATGVMCAAVWRRHGEVCELRAETLRQITLHQELRRCELSRKKLASAQKVSEKSVDVGTDTVRLAHNLIAAIPFTVLENIPATRAGAKVARKAHDRVAGNVYDSITIVNKLAGHGLRSLLKPEKPAEPPTPSQKEKDPPG